MATSKNKCTSCKNRFPVEQMIINRAGKFCGRDCLIAYSTKNKSSLASSGRKIQAKEKRKEEIEAEKAAKEERKALKARKLSLKKHSEWLADAQKAFNKFIRLRDSDDQCISCDRPASEIFDNDNWKPGGAWDCGHYLTRGSRPDLRFEELNAHKQCKSCNGGAGKHSGKAATVSARYREKLIDKIGLDKVEWLECEANHKLRKPSIEELKELIVKYKAKCKEIESCQ